MRAATSLAVSLVIASLASGIATAKTKKPATSEPAAEPPEAAPAPAAKAIEKKKWGEVDGKEVDLYTLMNKHGLIAKITNFGAILDELDVPDRKGKSADVVLGWDTLADYQKNDPHLGSTVGRV